MDLYTDASGTHHWGPTGRADGSMHNGQQSIPIKTLHGKNFMPLPQQLTHGATFGKGRKFYSTATTSQYAIYVWQKGSTRQPEIMAHTLYFCAACFDIHVMVTHIAGTTI